MQVIWPHFLAIPYGALGRYQYWRLHILILVEDSFHLRVFNKNMNGISGISRISSSLSRVGIEREPIAGYISLGGHELTKLCLLPV